MYSCIQIVFMNIPFNFEILFLFPIRNRSKSVVIERKIDTVLLNMVNIMTKLNLFDLLDVIFTKIDKDDYINTN